MRAVSLVWKRSPTHTSALGKRPLRPGGYATRPRAVRHRRSDASKVRPAASVVMPSTAPAWQVPMGRLPGRRF